jgi:hypothetical protein
MFEVVLDSWRGKSGRSYRWDTYTHFVGEMEMTRKKKRVDELMTPVN